MIGRVTLAIVSTCLVSAAAAHAQDTTADGVAALARGDYNLAAQILAPLAQDVWTNDSAAQFFMAGLYDSGRGVVADPLRACALYMRAAGDASSPFANAAERLLAAAVSRGEVFNEDCQRLASIGLDNGFQPVAFDLGVGHTVELTLAAATVTYDRESKRVPLMVGMPGARFLPIRQTDLATGPARSMMRHFVEVFLWQPKGRSGPWELQWNVFEVVRDALVRIDVPPVLASVAGDAPSQTIDLRGFATLRVDPDGFAEWAVLKGAAKASRRIASQSPKTNHPLP